MDLGSREMYHIGLRPEQGAAYALLTGDPGRVEAVAARVLLDDSTACASMLERALPRMSRSDYQFRLALETRI